MGTFIKDTKDFIWQVEDRLVPRDMVLVSMDVSGIYTNIYHEEAHVYFCSSGLTQKY